MDSINEAPVLLITFNRPDNTRKVYERIKQARVKNLYIANDAPRKDNIEDLKAREEIKKIIKEINWDCELHTLFQEKNLGCGWGPATAITWAFENENRLIILEDDCVPSLSFFSFCNQMLERYAYDNRIWLISGRSHQPDFYYFKEHDYLFTHYGHSWGWATWKRCWDHFNMNMIDFPEFIEMGGAINVLSTRKEGRLYNKIYKKLFNDKNLHTHAWDFQFGFSILKNSGLSIVPAKNLIENIGYIGTHSKKINKFTSMKAVEKFVVQKHPKFILVNNEYEKLHFNKHIKKIFASKTILSKIKNKGLKLFYKLWK
jgi:hypothetical protein